jgi:hypothetical protein
MFELSQCCCCVDESLREVVVCSCSAVRQCSEECNGVYVGWPDQYKDNYRYYTVRYIRRIIKGGRRIRIHNPGGLGFRVRVRVRG